MTIYTNGSIAFNMPISQETKDAIKALFTGFISSENVTVEDQSITFEDCLGDMDDTLGEMANLLIASGNGIPVGEAVVYYGDYEGLTVWTGKRFKSMDHEDYFMYTLTDATMIKLLKERGYCTSGLTKGNAVAINKANLTEATVKMLERESSSLGLSVSPLEPGPGLVIDLGFDAKNPEETAAMPYPGASAIGNAFPLDLLFMLQVAWDTNAKYLVINDTAPMVTDIVIDDALYAHEFKTLPAAAEYARANYASPEEYTVNICGHEMAFYSAEEQKGNSKDEQPIILNIAIEEPNDVQLSSLDFMTTEHKTVEDAMEAVRSAIRDYLKDHPDKDAETPFFSWGRAMMDVDSSYFAAHGLTPLTYDSFPVQHVFWEENALDSETYTGEEEDW